MATKICDGQPKVAGWFSDKWSYFTKLKTDGISNGNFSKHMPTVLRILCGYCTSLFGKGEHESEFYNSYLLEHQNTENELRHCDKDQDLLQLWLGTAMLRVCTSTSSAPEQETVILCLLLYASGKQGNGVSYIQWFFDRCTVHDFLQTILCSNSCFVQFLRQRKSYWVHNNNLGGHCSYKGVL